MSWQMAAVATIGAVTAKQQGTIGKFNQSVNERNAVIAEQESEALKKQGEFDIAQFNKSYQKLVGQTEVAFAKSGVVSGQDTAYRIAAANAKEKYLQENIMKYNSQVAVSKKLEEANFARIQGSMAREQARLAQFQTIGSTGTSLLNMSNFGTGTTKTTGSYGNRGTGMSGYGGGADT